jgi:hypothetical protein
MSGAAKDLELNLLVHAISLNFEDQKLRYFGIMSAWQTFGE